jgi:hypothetical protein
MWKHKTLLDFSTQKLTENPNSNRLIFCTKTNTHNKTNRWKTDTKYIIVTKADKGKTFVLTDKGMCDQKIETFIQENQFVKTNKYPTFVSSKQKHQAIQIYKT